MGKLQSRLEDTNRMEKAPLESCRWRHGELLPSVGPTSVGRIAEMAAKSCKAVAAKYRDPSTGATWSGRGRLPNWLADELAKGRKREEFLVG